MAAARGVPAAAGTGWQPRATVEPRDLPQRPAPDETAASFAALGALRSAFARRTGTGGQETAESADARPAAPATTAAPVYEEHALRSLVAANQYMRSHTHALTRRASPATSAAIRPDVPSPPSSMRPQSKLGGKAPPSSDWYQSAAAMRPAGEAHVHESTMSVSFPRSSDAPQAPAYTSVVARDVRSAAVDTHAAPRSESPSHAMPPQRRETRAIQSPPVQPQPLPSLYGDAEAQAAYMQQQSDSTPQHDRSYDVYRADADDDDAAPPATHDQLREDGPHADDYAALYADAYAAAMRATDGMDDLYAHLFTGGDAASELEAGSHMGTSVGDAPPPPPDSFDGNSVEPDDVEAPPPPPDDSVYGPPDDAPPSAPDVHVDDNDDESSAGPPPPPDDLDAESVAPPPPPPVDAPRRDPPPPPAAPHPQLRTAASLYHLTSLPAPPGEAHTSPVTVFRDNDAPPAVSSPRHVVIPARAAMAGTIRVAAPPDVDVDDGHSDAGPPVDTTSLSTLHVPGVASYAGTVPARPAPVSGLAAVRDHRTQRVRSSSAASPRVMPTPPPVQVDSTSQRGSLLQERIAATWRWFATTSDVVVTLNPAYDVMQNLKHSAMAAERYVKSRWQRRASAPNAAPVSLPPHAIVMNRSRVTPVRGGDADRASAWLKSVQMERSMMARMEEGQRALAVKRQQLTALHQRRAQRAAAAAASEAFNARVRAASAPRPAARRAVQVDEDDDTATDERLEAIMARVSGPRVRAGLQHAMLAAEQALAVAHVMSQHLVDAAAVSQDRASHAGSRTAAVIDSLGSIGLLPADTGSDAAVVSPEGSAFAPGVAPTPPAGIALRSVPPHARRRQQ